MQFFEKLIGKEQNSLGYSLGAALSSSEKTPIWKIYESKNKETKEAALVFVYETRKEDANKSLRNVARNGLQKLKTLRHPNILKFYNAVESESSISFATEEALPLSEYVQRYGPLTKDSIYWGLHCLAKALEFIHNDCKLSHGKISPASVFITPGGDWKLGAFEASVNDLTSLRETMFLQDERYCSPELLRQQWNVLSKAPIYAVDSWAFGCIIQELFSGFFRSAEQLKKLDAIPKDLVFDYQKLLSSNPSSRIPPGKLLENNCLQSNSFVNMNLFLENFELKESLERDNFLHKITDDIDSISKTFLRFKLVPILCTSIECGSGGVSVFNCICAIFSHIVDNNFRQDLVRQHVIRWFSEAKPENRVFRTELVNKIELFAPFMDREKVNKVVFPFLCQNMKDLGSPALRDSSVKSIVHIIEVLDEKQANSVLMSHLAKLQLDKEPAIRANTTVCIGKIASYLSDSTKKKVLIPAFTRALKDPFPPTRVAGLVSLVKTAGSYEPSDMAKKILPSVVPCLVDEDNETRTQAFECLEFFLSKIRQLHEQMSQGTANSLMNETNVRNKMEKGKESGKNSGWNFTSLAASLAMQLSETIADAHTTQQPTNADKHYRTNTTEQQTSSRDIKASEGFITSALSGEKTTPERKGSKEDAENWDLLIDFSEPLPYNKSSENIGELGTTANSRFENKYKTASSSSTRTIQTTGTKTNTAALSRTRTRPTASSLDQIVSESSRSRRKQAKEKTDDDDWSALLGGPDIPPRK